MYTERIVWIVRRSRACVVIAWLLLQLVSIAIVPVAFWPHTETAEVKCLCVQGQHAYCPMHHHRPAPRSPLCAMRAAESTDVSVLLSPLTGFEAPTPTAADWLPIESVTLSIADDGHPLLRPAAPDPPPPRA